MTQSFTRCSLVFFFFKQKTAYEMRIREWSSDVCSSDLLAHDERAQRRMPDICPVIDPFRQGIDDIEIFPEGRPTPVDSGLHRRAGDIFGALEVPHHQSPPGL